MATDAPLRLVARERPEALRDLVLPDRPQLEQHQADYCNARVTVRLEGWLLEEIRAFGRHLESLAPGVRVTEGAAIRAVLLHGLDALRASRAGCLTTSTTSTPAVGSSDAKVTSCPTTPATASTPLSDARPPTRPRTPASQRGRKGRR